MKKLSALFLLIVSAALNAYPNGNPVKWAKPTVDAVKSIKRETARVQSATNPNLRKYNPPIIRNGRIQVVKPEVKSPGRSNSITLINPVSTLDSYISEKIDNLNDDVILFDIYENLRANSSSTDIDYYELIGDWMDFSKEVRQRLNDEKVREDYSRRISHEAMYNDALNFISGALPEPQTVKQFLDSLNNGRADSISVRSVLIGAMYPTTAEVAKGSTAEYLEVLAPYVDRCCPSLMPLLKAGEGESSNEVRKGLLALGRRYRHDFSRSGMPTGVDIAQAILRMRMIRLVHQYLIATSDSYDSAKIESYAELTPMDAETFRIFRLLSTGTEPDSVALTRTLTNLALGAHNYNLAATFRNKFISEAKNDTSEVRKELDRQREILLKDVEKAKYETDWMGLLNYLFTDPLQPTDSIVRAHWYAKSMENQCNKLLYGSAEPTATLKSIKSHADSVYALTDYDRYFTPEICRAIYMGNLARAVASMEPWEQESAVMDAWQMNVDILERYADDKENGGLMHVALYSTSDIMRELNERKRYTDALKVLDPFMPLFRDKKSKIDWKAACGLLILGSDASWEIGQQKQAKKMLKLADKVLKR